MNKLIVLTVSFSLSLVSGVMAKNLTLSGSESHTVVGDESYESLVMQSGTTLTILEGTSITMSNESLNDGGTIVLDGGDYTVNARMEFGETVGGTLLANSGTFSVLDHLTEPPTRRGWQMTDNPPSAEQEARMIIDDAIVFVEPRLNFYADRYALLTFIAGGDGYLDLETIDNPGGPSGKWDPNIWLADSQTYPGYGLFAPEGEEIRIRTDVATGHTIVTSEVVFHSTENVFTWGDLLADGSWGNAAGWKENGAATTNIPTIDELAVLADEVEVQSGTLRVDTADRGAWSLAVLSGATAVVSDGRELNLIEDLTIASGGVLELDNGSLTIVQQEGQDLDVEGTVAFTGTGTGAPAGGDFDGDGDVDGSDFLLWQRGGSPVPDSAADLAEWQANFGRSGSPLSQLILDSGSVAAVMVSSSGLIDNVSNVSIGQLTLSSTSRLVKQGGGTIYLEQSGGANSLAAGSQLSVEEGTLVATSNAAVSALDSGTIGLDGGTLVLTSTQAGAAAFDSAVQVSRDSTIRAAQSGTGALAGETVTLGGTHGIATSSGAIGTLETADGYTLILAGDVSGPGQLDFGDGAAVQVQGTVTPAGVGYSGDLSQVSVSGSIGPTSGYYFNPTAANPDMTIGLPIAGGLEVVIGDLDAADGSVGFTGTLAHTGGTRLQRGALRLGGSDNSPTASQIEFEAHDLNRAAVVESSAAAYNPIIGTAAGNVHWIGAGGFASGEGGTGTTVTVNSGATLNWDSDTGGFNGQALQLGSTTADAPVILTNNLNLGSAAERVIQVASNPGTGADVARLTGVISSSGGSSDLLRINKTSGNGFQNSLLELLGTNTFANTLRLDSGSVYALEGTGLPTSANVQFSGNDASLETVLVTEGTFTRSIGTGAGQVSWEASAIDAQGGGFAARGNPLAVTLAGGGTVPWNDPAGFNGQDLHLGSQYADDVVTFNNDLDGQGTSHTIRIYDNPDSANDRVEMNTDISDVNGLRFGGNGRVVLNGNIAVNTAELSARSGNVVVIFNGNQTLGPMFEGGNVEVRGEAMLFLNGTVDVGDDVQFEDTVGGPSIGGSGRVNFYNGSNGKFDLEPNAHLRPGPDVNATGTLTIDLLAGGGEFTASIIEMEPTSTYHMEFAEEFGQAVHDSVTVENTDNLGFVVGYVGLEREGATGWNLDLSALESLTGLISPSDEFDLFTTSGSHVRFADFDTQVDTIYTAPLLFGQGDITSATILPSADFDTTGAAVKYDIDGLGGRVYVTGLVYTGPSAASVPEPAAGLLSLLGSVGMAAMRWRMKRQHLRFY